MKIESGIDELQWRSMNNIIIASGIKLDPEDGQESAVTNFINYNKLGVHKT